MCYKSLFEYIGFEIESMDVCVIMLKKMTNKFHVCNERENPSNLFSTKE